MNTNPDGTLLKVTRAIICISMGVIIFAAVMVGIASVALPFQWDLVLARIAAEHPGFSAQNLMLAIYAIFAFVFLLLALAWQILAKLLKIIASVAEGDPFNRENTQRLKFMGW